jgi:hypothetical protein
VGKWEDLRKTYARFKAGEISREQGAEEIQRRLGTHGGDRRSEQARKDQASNSKLGIKHGNNRKHVCARLRRAGDEATAAAIEAGAVSANSVAVDRGWVRKRKSDPLTELKRWWDRANDNDRSQFEDYLDAWHADQADRA